MSVTTEAEMELTLSSLVALDQDVEPYVLQWSAAAEEDGMMDIFVLAVMKRQDGVLLAVPQGVLPEEDIQAGNHGGEGVLGLSNLVQVPSVILDGGVVNPTGEEIGVLLVDFSAEIVESLRRVEPFEDIAYGFDLDSPYALPDPKTTLTAALDWIRSAEPQGDLAFYTAEEAPMAGGSPMQSRPKRKAKAKVAPRGVGTLEDSLEEGLPQVPQRERTKRVTTSSLALSWTPS